MNAATAVLLGWEPNSYLTADPLRRIRNDEVLRAAVKMRDNQIDYLASKVGIACGEVLAPILLGALRQRR